MYLHHLQWNLAWWELNKHWLSSLKTLIWSCFLEPFILNAYNFGCAFAVKKNFPIKLSYFTFHNNFKKQAESVSLLPLWKWGIWGIDRKSHSWKEQSFWHHVPGFPPAVMQTFRWKVLSASYISLLRASCLEGMKSNNFSYPTGYKPQGQEKQHYLSENSPVETKT